MAHAYILRTAVAVAAMLVVALSTPGVAQSPQGPGAMTPEQQLKSLRAEMQAKLDAIKKDCQEKTHAVTQAYEPKLRALRAQDTSGGGTQSGAPRKTQGSTTGRSCMRDADCRGGVCSFGKCE